MLHALQKRPLWYIRLPLTACDDIINRLICFQQKITDEIGMPPGKQKLQWESIFYKVNSIDISYLDSA
jgi:hypothetical protein